MSPEMTEWLAKLGAVTGCFGAVTGLLGTVLGIIALYQQHLQHKAERQERVLGKAHVEGGHLHVLVYNSGRIPVYLKHVDLMWKAGRIRKNWPLYRPLPVRNENGEETYHDTRSKSTGNAVAVGDEERFMLSNLDYPTLQSILRLLRWNYWVSIKSAGGEIARIKGGHLRPCLLELAQIGVDSKTLPVAPVAPEIRAFFAKWTMHYYGGRDTSGGICLSPPDKATYAEYNFTFSLVSQKSTALVITSVVVRFMKGTKLVLEDVPGDSSQQHRAAGRSWFERISVFTLPPLEAVNHEARGTLTGERVKMAAVFDRAVLVATTQDGEVLEWPIYENRQPI
jgi:hypothetical protein